MIWRVCIYARTGDYPARKIYHSANTKSLWLYIIHLYLIQSIHNFKATRSFTQHACILAFSIHTEYTHTAFLDFLYSTQHFIEGSKGMGILPKSTIQNVHPAELMVDWIASECKGHQAQYHNITAKLSSIQYWYRAKQIWYSIISIWQYFDVPSMGKCIDRWYATCGGMKSNWHLSRHQTHDNENAAISSLDQNDFAKMGQKWINDTGLL